jgi:5-methyltetrahydropteroyltriglutamate--homocysteine methyltransferase
MKKWITSNYHYMVPEFDETTKLSPDFSIFLNDIARGKELLGKDCATPVILGPVSVARLTKISCTSTTQADLVKALIPIYKRLMDQVAKMGFSEVQIHEPTMVFAEPELAPLLALAYPDIIRDASKSLAINMVTFMDDVGAVNYQWLIAQPEISVISMDFSTARGGKSLEFVAQYGFPPDKTLGAGIIDARNVWKVIPQEIIPVITQLTALASNVRIQPSGSLQYCPWDLSREGDGIKKHPAAAVLSFAAQKLEEVSLVAAAANDLSLLNGHAESWKTFHNTRLQLASPHAIEISRRMGALSETAFVRSEDYKARRSKQLPGVPALPTTTIGSFPQTTEIRRLRAQWKNGSLSDEQYKAGIDQQIAFCIGIQEAIGLDVLVRSNRADHGVIVCYLHAHLSFLPYNSLRSTEKLNALTWLSSLRSKWKACCLPPMVGYSRSALVVSVRPSFGRTLLARAP